MRARGLGVVLACAVLTAQLVGVCEAVCALTQADHHAMVGGHAAHSAAAHAGHQAAAAMAEHAVHQAAGSAGAHGEQPPDGAVAVEGAGKQGHPHCPVCDGSGPCSIGRVSMPSHASLTAGEVPGATRFAAPGAIADAPAVEALRGESLARPPGSPPPRG